MENATKALLIAGSVLIAIVLIAVGIKILSSTSGVTKEVDNLSSTMEASIFNSRFTQYEGTQKGSSVKALIRLIEQNNIKGEHHIDCDTSAQTIDINKNYIVDYQLGTDRVHINYYYSYSTGNKCKHRNRKWYKYWYRRYN